MMETVLVVRNTVGLRDMHAATHEQSILWGADELFTPY